MVKILSNESDFNKYFKFNKEINMFEIMEEFKDIRILLPIDNNFIKKFDKNELLSVAHTSIVPITPTDYEKFNSTVCMYFSSYGYPYSYKNHVPHFKFENNDCYIEFIPLSEIGTNESLTKTIIHNDIYQYYELYTLREANNN